VIAEVGGEPGAQKDSLKLGSRTRCSADDKVEPVALVEPRAADVRLVIQEAVDTTGAKPQVVTDNPCSSRRPRSRIRSDASS
jgi:hypothetical protein